MRGKALFARLDTVAEFDIQSSQWRGGSMAARPRPRKIVCGACGERVREDTAREAYRTTDQDGDMRFTSERVPGSTLTHLCPACYGEWDVGADDAR
jgi:hypothetical protein